MTREVLSGVRPAQRRRLTEDVTAHLLELIAAGSGEEVVLPPERELCRQLAVSRNVVREALSGLEQMRVIETRGRTRTAFVTRAQAQLVARVPGRAATRELMLEPIELRLILEPEAAALAAERRDEADLAEITRWVDAMAGGVDRGEPVIEADTAFHAAIARATHNGMLADLVAAVAEALRPSRELSFRPPGAAGDALADHRTILAAVRDGDAAAARHAMATHVHHVRDLIRASLDTR